MRLVFTGDSPQAPWFPHCGTSVFPSHMKGSCIGAWRLRTIWGSGSLHSGTLGAVALPHSRLSLVPTRAGRKTSSMLEVDDEGGRMFLRVLLHLTMHDYPSLVSGALQLLFKHCSQRQEAMHTFKQVRGAHSLGPAWSPGHTGI